MRRQFLGDDGDGTHPLYQHLKSEAPGLLGSKAVKWNFTKFLIDRSGKVVRRYGPADSCKRHVHGSAVRS